MQLALPSWLSKQNGVICKLEVGESLHILTDIKILHQPNVLGLQNKSSQGFSN